MMLRNFINNCCQRHFRLVVGFWAVFVLVAITGLGIRFTASSPIIDNSVGVWFLRDDPNFASYKQNNDAFGNKEWSLLLLETPSVTDPGFLHDLAHLTSALEALPHVRRVVSLAKFFDPAAAQPAESLRAKLSGNKELEHMLLPVGWSNKSVVLLQSDNFLDDQDPYRLELIDSVHRLVLQMSKVNDHALAGTMVINAELNRAARHDALRFYFFGDRDGSLIRLDRFA